MSVSGGSGSLSTVTGASSLSASKDGEIQLILGPMFSGKTSELMRRVRRYKLYKKCLLISYKVRLESSPRYWPRATLVRHYPLGEYDTTFAAPQSVEMKGIACRVITGTAVRQPLSPTTELS